MKTDVRFPSNGMMLAGHLHTPDTPSAAPSPAIVVGHPATGVKEQTAAIYAQRLAEQGFVALTFDAAYQGESEGEPRGLEDPFQRADDFRNAVSYLTTRDDVDAERIGVLGICASGGYVPFAAQTDHRMKAVATVSGVDLPGFFRAGDPAAFEALVAQAGQARSEEAAGKPVRMVPVLPDSIDESTPKAVAEFFDYYKTPRAQHPRSIGAYALRSVDKLAQYDSYAEVDKIAPRPLLMIAGSEAETLPFSQGAVAKAGDTAELFEIEGATHVDLYDRDEYVTPAAVKLTEFFNQHLA
ncbi:alpha/beta hydrolase [Saccharopolyspora sp. NPDC050642]|uniref:alpha/beta hydrolase n=1 Tax=Saccharopolyspora sp. NPDC050642 TaxID=3157099 RepID=UPI00340A4B54